MRQQESETSATKRKKVDVSKNSESKRDNTAVTVSFQAVPEVPPYQKDYAKTIFLSWFAKPREEPKEWPNYCLYDLGIRDCEKYLYTLLADGLLKEASPKEKIGFLKVAELKSILRNAGLPSTGKKEQLVQIALENIDKDTINNYVAEKAQYCLSPSGYEFLSSHEQYAILYKHKNWGITWQEFDNAHRQDVSVYDTIWGLLNKRVSEECKQNYGRNAYQAMAECEIERGQPEAALSLFLQVLYIDLCFSPFFMGFAPSIVSSIRALGDYYHLGLLQGAFSMRIPGRTFTQEEFEKIVESIIRGDIDTESVETDLRKRKKE